MDDKIEWDHFALQDLETYEAMYKRLYLEETEQIVKAYENYTTRIWEELQKRNMTTSHL